MKGGQRVSVRIDCQFGTHLRRQQWMMIKSAMALLVCFAQLPRQS
jgi:hypothetical protein